MLNKCKLVRDTCRYVFTHSQHIKYHKQNLQTLANKFSYTLYNDFQHHQLTKQQDQHTLLYLFVLDCLNFGFWTMDGFSYQNLAANVKTFAGKYVINDAFQLLCNINQNQLKDEFFGNINVQLADERARILRQMSNVIKTKFQCKFTKLIQNAQKSVIKLLDILVQNFPNFQDHCLYKGHQIFFYKRAQILIADIYAKFEGKSHGQFIDINQLTMFPDYRVPQVLNHYKITQYTDKLQSKINNSIYLTSGSQQEIQIRAAAVTIVEEIKQWLKTKDKLVKSIEVDWFLWEQGEKNNDKMGKHHQTLSIYY